MPRVILSLWLLSLALLATAPQLMAQGQTSQPQAQPQQQEAPPEAGGPGGDIGPIAVPKKKEEAAPPKPKPPKKPEGIPGDFSIHVDVPLVTVPVTVLTKDGQFVPGLKQDNFKVSEDGVPQQITNFNVSEAPITAVLLVEFAATNYAFMYDALNASYYFAESLKPQDWVAVVAFDMKPQIMVDFTQDKRAVFAALNQLRIPGFSETNVFDALYDTIDRLDRLEGRKYIVLIGSGRDTFSKLTFDKILKKVKDTRDIVIYTISTGEAFRIWFDARYGGNPNAQVALMDYLQADNEMATFSRMTGGRWYKPRFEGELPEIFRDVAGQIRNQYTLAYHPSNTKQDGSYRKLKVELVAPDGGPLRVQDQKGHQLKVQVVAREGYTAKHVVE